MTGQSLLRFGVTSGLSLHVLREPSLPGNGGRPIVRGQFAVGSSILPILCDITIHEYTGTTV